MRVWAMSVGGFALVIGGLALGASADGGDERQRLNGGAHVESARDTKATTDISPLIITEVLYDSSAATDSDGEWFEVFNPTSEPIDLNGITVSDAGGSSGNRFTINQSLVVDPGAYVVLARLANLGDDSIGVTADFVWSDGAGSFALANTRDTIYFLDGATEILAFGYDESPATGTAWPRGSESSIQLHPTLSKKLYQDVPEAWCIATSSLGDDQLGTPGAANDACAGVDLDEDGFIGEEDCDDSDPDVNAGALEVFSDGVDNDCDGVQLWQVINDGVGDSAFGLTNELSSFAIGWNDDELVLAFDYTIESNAVIWYLELGLSGGETNFNSGQGYNGAFPTNVSHSQGIDLMAGFFGQNPLYLYSVVNNNSTDISGDVSDMFRVNSEADGEPGYGYIRVPFSAIYTSLPEGKVVPTGSTLKILGVIRGSDNQGAADIAPNNEALPFTVYAEVPLDPNEDGLPDAGVFLDSDEDGVTVIAGDCDDDDAGVYPGAEEICDSDDQDCDGNIDEGSKETLYVDVDRDGYGGTLTVLGCPSSDGLTRDSGDCNDNDETIYPDAEELCDELDNDCDEAADEGAGPTYFPDSDDDGFRSDDGDIQSCDPIQGYVLESALIDCNDNDGAVNPDATEVCDGQDNDCNGDIDGADASDALTFYLDDDGDGYGEPSTTEIACEASAGYVSDDTDCNDDEASANPGATEICDGLDNNCDGEVDEDSASDALTFYADGDEDGYGDPEDSLMGCEAPAGYIEEGGDCSPENPDINPGVTEVCDGEDNDCSGEVDGSDASDALTFYLDEDGDGFGLTDETTLACAEPEGYATLDGDCADDAPATYPGADDIPGDGIDQDCDGADAATPTPETPTPETPTPETPTPTQGEVTPTPDTPTPSATPETPTPETPTPTAEPVTPTATPTPTATATATPTPTATATPDGPQPTPTGGEGDGGCDCATGAQGADPSSLAGTLLLLGLGIGLRRRRQL